MEKIKKVNIDIMEVMIYLILKQEKKLLLEFQKKKKMKEPLVWGPRGTSSLQEKEIILK